MVDCPASAVMIAFFLVVWNYAITPWVNQGANATIKKAVESHTLAYRSAVKTLDFPGGNLSCESTPRVDGTEPLYAAYSAKVELMRDVLARPAAPLSKTRWLMSENGLAGPRRCLTACVEM